MIEANRPKFDSPFNPLNSDHAIEHVRFAVYFKDGLSRSSLEMVRRDHDRWREDFPALSDVELEAASTQGLVRVQGCEFSFLRPDGTHIWRMIVAANKIEIECTLYTRWNKVWAKAFRNLRSVLDVIASSAPDISIGAVELNVKDVFTCDETEYSVEQIFSGDNRIMPSRFMSSQNDVWHSNMGFFEKNKEDRILNNINVSSTKHGKLLYVSLEHMQQWRFDIEEIILKDDKEVLSERMGEMHYNNKILLRDLLVDSLLEKIGLTGGVDVGR